jgi:hypothetical protein
MYNFTTAGCVSALSSHVRYGVPRTYNYSWSAVVRGALLQAVVQKRKIRAHYGVKFREPWNPASHEHGELAAFAREHKYILSSGQ